jgi:hypothetical protein
MCSGCLNRERIHASRNKQNLAAPEENERFQKYEHKRIIRSAAVTPAFH